MEKKKSGRKGGGTTNKKFRYSLKVPRPSHQKSNQELQEQFKRRLPERVKELQRQYPTAQIEVWSFDEHRLGLKPILRRVWTPIGSRPIATVNHRYEWLYLYSFVHLKTGQTEWFIVPKVNVEWFKKSAKVFCRSYSSWTRQNYPFSSRPRWLAHE